MKSLFSLHIGLNLVDPHRYNEWSGLLNFAEDDALAMENLARKAKFNNVITLLGKRATRDNILETLRYLASMAKDGDLVLITFSGHGGQLPDVSGDEPDEPKKTFIKDGLDETWCCYDGQLLDDELYLTWSKFMGGVRIVVLSDSCHSGTVIKVFDDEQLNEFNLPVGAKVLPQIKARNTYYQNRFFYDSIAAQTPKVSETDMPAVLLIAGCKDEEISYEGFSGNGQFTAALLEIWKDGAFQGGYSDLFAELESILTKLPKSQTPNYYRVGRLDQEFDLMRPFTVLPDGFDNEKKLVAADPTPVVFSQTGELLIEFGSVPKALGPSLKSIEGNFGPAYSTHNGFMVASYVVDNTTKAAGVNDWDLAHLAYIELKEGDHGVIYIEPNQPNRMAEAQLDELPKNTGQKEEEIFIKNWPRPDPLEGNFLWHLQKSQLETARDAVMKMDGILIDPVRIAHFDTGISSNSEFWPENLKLGGNYIPGEDPNNIFDKDKIKLIEMQGHGASTLALLAGRKVPKEKTLGGHVGYIGAIPFADVYVFRIADSVALLRTDAFEKAVYHAVDNLKCQVITMSMGGLPSRRWAKAVNYAYEKGVTIVTAAGDCFKDRITSMIPKCVLYPARFERVICVVGMAHNEKPYVFEANSYTQEHPVPGAKAMSSENMQGSWGPDSAMYYAIAGYAPNNFWVSHKKDDKGQIIRWFDMRGGGTSSAVPQIAAAAALWITKHREELKAYAEPWQKVEAVRNALFKSAHPARDVLASGPDPYLGHGTLRANDALNIAPPDASALRKSPEAKTKHPLFELLFKGNKNSEKHSFDTLDDNQKNMLMVELMQLSYIEPGLYSLSEQDWTDQNNIEAWVESNWATTRQTVLNSGFASKTIKKMMG